MALQCIKAWKPERIWLCACCQLKACLVYWNLFMTGYFCFWLAVRRESCRPYHSFHRPMSFLVLAWHCLLLLGLISSSRAKAAGHSLSTRCMLFSSRPPFFFSKSRGNGLSCPPASRKWVIDNPWTFPRGYSVAVRATDTKTARPLRCPESDSKKLYFEPF